MRSTILAFAQAAFPFQWAPTLGGECYLKNTVCVTCYGTNRFQWAPTLGGECYEMIEDIIDHDRMMCFNGHPPLGVNATV